VSEGGYFLFLHMLYTRVIIATISIPKAKSSVYVTIAHPSFQRVNRLPFSAAFAAVGNADTIIAQ
jgi:hypothetical protein